MKKETFIGIVKECIRHTEQAERMGQSLKDLISIRSSLTDFMGGFDTIFYDDLMVENILRILEKELEDEEELLVAWFYEYRTMNFFGHPNIMKVTFKDDLAEITYNIGTDSVCDDENLSTLYDAIMKSHWYLKKS